MNADIWNVLHDGSILRVTGSVPGNIQFAIWIDYLRDRFSDPGNRIILTLHGCTALSYKLCDSESPLTDLPAIEVAAPEILSAKDWTDPTEVHCVNGTLHVQATDFSLSLDSGRAITFDELCEVSHAYWTAFDKRSPKSTS